MLTTLKIIKKNLKLLIRSKTSALVVIFGPLLLIFLVGMAFDNSNVYRIKIGAYAPVYNGLTDSFLDKLSENNFKVIKHFSEEECIDNIKRGKINTCVVFSSNFTVGGEANRISFHVDYSKINLVYMILDTISAEISARSDEISTDMTNILLEKIEQTKAELDAQKPILQQMTEANNNLNAEISKAYDRLKSLDTSMSLDDFDLERVKSDTKTVTNLTGFVLLHYSIMEANVKAKVAAIAREGNVSSNSSDEIDGILHQTRLKLENINRKLANRSGSIDQVMNDIDDNLNSVKSKLEQAGLARTDVFSYVEVMRGVITGNLKNIVRMQDSINNMLSNLGSIAFTQSRDIVNPVTTVINPITSEKTHLNYVFPSLIVLVVMFISILLSSTLVVMEKTSRAYFRNFITPTKDITFIMATYMTAGFLLLIQLVIILGISAYFFKAQVISSIGQASLILVIITTTFILIGMLIGYLFNSEETATLASISVGSIFLLMSNVLLPLESMPGYVVELAQFNPFIISEFLLKKSILFETSLKVIQNDILMLLGYIVVLFVLVFMAQKIMKQDYLLKYTRRLAPIKRAKK